ncbi:MAG: hypothetical protein MI725_04050 [Pirellulales bacterium]|nr:hypothetical protein [Pirellulales bacterium]
MPVDSCVVASRRDGVLPGGKALYWSALVLGSLMIVATAGCGGCDSQQNAEQDQDDQDKQSEKADKKKKDRLEIGPIRALVGPDLVEINDADSPGKNSQQPLVVKPGHWTATVQEMKANYEDFVGQTTSTLIDKNRQPARLAPTHFRFHSTRPVVLAKGLPKRVLGEVFVPEQTAGELLQITLRNRETGRSDPLPAPAVMKMPSYQYYVVVLAKEASRYGFLKVTDAVKAPWEEQLEEAPQAHYRVVLADATKGTPLPDTMLSWTSIAYVVWDEVDPTRFSTEQQEALVDWLHWGGRLIVNGPDSLDTLRGSFLDPYLPVDKAGARSFTAADFGGWSNYWSSRTGGRSLPALEPLKPWSGVALRAKDHARELAGGAQLFYEGDVGRGGIVVSAMQLAERDFINWPGYDSFLNAALLRRPRRKHFEGPYGGLCIHWAGQGDRRLDAHLTTGLRLFARDHATQANVTRTVAAATEGSSLAADGATVDADRPGGLAAWNAFGPGATVAREALTSAAAVQIPGPGFVVVCLGVYLFVLAPLNWTVFRSIGHVEWAWIAAPAIAIFGTLAIVRLAQLDIGFVRSQTEIALLELQGPYERGLLSRYTALYSSLSTTYNVTYENPATFATPFPASEEDKFKIGDRTWDVLLDKHRQTRLSGLVVSSASTRMVQSEQMFALEGALKLGKSSRGHTQLENETGYNLRDLVVVERSFDRRGNARLKGSWIGDLRTGNSAVLGLTSLSIPEGQLPYAKERRQAAESAYRQPLEVDALMRLAFQFPGATDPRYAQQEECRVVGVIDEVLPGAEVAPTSSQIHGTTVVLAHLRYGGPPHPQPDLNSRNDVLKK